MDHSDPSTEVTSTELFRYFFKLAWVGFGGPFAHISMMQHDTVEVRRWLSKDEFAEMLGITNMLPGPNSTEMAIHIGYVKGGRKGAIVSGLAFTLPAFAVMLVLSWLYFQLGSLPSVAGIFYGMNPAVIAVIIIAAFRLAGTTGKEPRAIFIAAIVFLLVLLTNINEAIILLSAGIVGVILYSPRMGRFWPVLVIAPTSLSALSMSTPPPAEVELFLLFLRAGLLLFGTGLVIIPLIGSDVVERFGWMSYRQFTDGVTLGQVTPGPVVKTAAFVGYAVAGPLGAAIATFGVFLPPFVIVTLLAPMFKRMKSNEILQGFVKGVRPGAIGAVLAVAVSLGQTAFVDAWTIGIGGLSLVALLKFKAPMALTIIVSGIAGTIIAMFFL